MPVHADGLLWTRRPVPVRRSAELALKTFFVRRRAPRRWGIGDIEAQTRQVCENIRFAVEEAGGTMDDICRVDVYLRNMEHFERIHKVRREYFRPPAPASTMVEVCKMTSPEYLIEISAIAVIGN
jgi:enamine deaminase RidA (YjgF/YER057c/UK114 family)